jgi:hypothetical protein
MLFAIHNKTRPSWDSKTIASFVFVKRGFSTEKYLPIRKSILLGILTHHPDPSLRNRLLDEVEGGFHALGITAPRPNCRTDEFAFQLLKNRR